MTKTKGFYTKNGKVRPITSKNPRTGTMQQGTAHLNVPKKLSKKRKTKKNDILYEIGKFSNLTPQGRAEFSKTIGGLR